MVEDATFTSVWDGGHEVTTSCKVNMETKEVFDIGMVSVEGSDVDILDREYVTIDGKEYSVSDALSSKDTEFWYT